MSCLLVRQRDVAASLIVMQPYLLHLHTPRGSPLSFYCLKDLALEYVWLLQDAE